MTQTPPTSNLAHFSELIYNSLPTFYTSNWEGWNPSTATLGDVAYKNTSTVLDTVTSVVVTIHEAENPQFARGSVCISTYAPGSTDPTLTVSRGPKSTSAIAWLVFDPSTVTCDKLSELLDAAYDTAFDLAGE